MKLEIGQEMCCLFDAFRCKCRADIFCELQGPSYKSSWEGLFGYRLVRLLGQRGMLVIGQLKFLGLAKVCPIAIRGTLFFAKDELPNRQIMSLFEKTMQNTCKQNKPGKSNPKIYGLKFY